MKFTGSQFQNKWLFIYIFTFCVLYLFICSPLPWLYFCIFLFLWYFLGTLFLGAFDTRTRSCVVSRTFFVLLCWHMLILDAWGTSLEASSFSWAFFLALLGSFSFLAIVSFVVLVFLPSAPDSAVAPTSTHTCFSSIFFFFFLFFFFFSPPHHKHLETHQHFHFQSHPGLYHLLYHHRDQTVVLFPYSISIFLWPESPHAYHTDWFGQSLLKCPICLQFPHSISLAFCFVLYDWKMQ